MNKFSNMYSNLAQQANTFTHNARNEVVSATLGTNEYTYSYDPIGNRTASTQNAEAKSYISNPLNQYITIQQEEQTVAPIYDADGNMLSSPSGWSFTWNAENRLVSASRGGVVVSYTYDAFGRMISKQIIGAENKTITYTWDVFNIIKETENNISTYNIWGLDVDGTMQGAGGVGGLLAVAKSGNFYTPTYDANGNITEYVSANGNVVAQYQYTAFGEIISQSGMSFTHRFSTKPYCTTTGLIEYQFRKYDPALGRWLNRDPIEEAGGLNLYAFCGNSIMGVDVLGRLTSSEAYSHYISGPDDPKDKTKRTPIGISFDEIDTSGVRVKEFPVVKRLLAQGKVGQHNVVWQSKDDNLVISTRGDQALYLGNVSLKLEGVLKINNDCTWEFSGTLKCFDDVYDFNKSTHRSIIGEFLTLIGRKSKGKPFYIEIRGKKHIKESGRIK